MISNSSVRKILKLQKVMILVKFMLLILIFTQMLHLFCFHDFCDLASCECYNEYLGNDKVTSVYVSVSCVHVCVSAS